MSTRLIFQTNFRICSDRPKTSQYYTMAQFEIKDGIAIIPEGTTEIEESAFDKATQLQAIYVPAKKTDYYKQRLPEKHHSLIVELEPVKKAKKQ